jgi:hypothetical protein
MFDRATVTEEHFGILTDDELALEATLIRPAGLADEEVHAVQAWVPKYPLTRSSVLTTARAEVAAIGASSKMVNLTFDLRGSGESDGIPSDEGFQIDLHSAREWAKERFGPDVIFRTLGFPDLGEADRLVALPLRPGVLAELYRYDPDDVSQGRVLYLSQYTDFSRDDDALCRKLAEADYTVHGGDMMRYLLPAAPLTLEALWEDGGMLGMQIGRPFYLIARAFAAGPALAMAAGVRSVGGVIVTGPAQAGLEPPHLFAQDDLARLQLADLVRQISPRPVVFLWNRAAAGRVPPDGLKSVYEQAGKPSLWGVVPQLDALILLNALKWLASNQSG